MFTGIMTYCMWEFILFTEYQNIKEKIIQAGATEVIAPDIYDGKVGAQFADCLLVKLPKFAAKRKAIRKVCGQLSKRKLGAFLPDKDFGETHLYPSLA